MLLIRLFIFLCSVPVAVVVDVTTVVVAVTGVVVVVAIAVTVVAVIVVLVAAAVVVVAAFFAGVAMDLFFCASVWPNLDSTSKRPM